MLCLDDFAAATGFRPSERQGEFPDQQRENLLFPGFHGPRLLRCAAFMIITEQMQNAVDQQEPDFMLKGNLRFRGIRCGPFRGDDHVAEQVRIKPGPDPFLLSERNHIGRPVPLQIVPVDPADLFVIDDQNRQFRIRRSRDV